VITLIDPVAGGIVILILLILLHLLYQNYRRSKFYAIKGQTYLKVNIKDPNYWSRASLFVFMALVDGKRQFQQNADYSSYLGALLMLLIGIVLFVESSKAFEICERGIFFPNRYVDWNDIVDYEWTTTLSKKVERLSVLSKRRPDLLLSKEYELSMIIPIDQKEDIKHLIAERSKLTE